MVQKKLTINLPESPDILNKLLITLREFGLITEKKARSIKKQKDQAAKEPSKTRWQLAAERLRSEAYLKGEGEKVKKLTQDFRDSFLLQS